ncbi:hypothetical protein [Nocardioides campestrisoli]|uniref:hypothetical protein n=1 Tax=Nocardioides campestrisoli TaxID=2736757 RepID=UPI0015E6C21B|nr:hypothetical protein [Nocardioides campestrisoli]
MRAGRSRRPVLLRQTGAVVLTTLLLGLAACGDDAGDGDGGSAAEGSPSVSVSPTPSESVVADPDAPACDEVWVAGKRIPGGYDGCQGEDGFVPADTLSCSSGQVLVRYDDRFYGVRGGKAKVTESTLADDDRYRDSVARCRG